MKIISTVNQYEECLSDRSFYEDKSSESVLFFNINLTHVREDFLSRQNLCFENMVFLNCTLTNKTINFFVHKKLKVINCNFSGSTISIIHAYESKGKGSVCILNSVVSKIGSYERFLDFYLINSNLDEFCLEDVVYKKYHVYVISSNINEFYFGKDEFRASHTYISRNNFYAKDSNISKLYVGNNSSTLCDVDGDCGTIRSFNDASVKSTVLGGTIADSDFRDISLGKVKFNPYNSIFLRCNVSNLDLRNIKIEDTPEGIKPTELKRIDFHSCVGVDTVKFPRGASVSHFKSDNYTKALIPINWSNPCEDNRQPGEI